MNRYRYLPSYHYDNTQTGTIYNPAEPQLRDYTIVSKQKRMVFPESTILEPQGWVKQEDGSWYVKYASTPYKKIIYDNTDNYSGQLFISYMYKYLDKTLSHQGAVIHIEYMDGTAEFLNTRITDEWTTVYNITKLGKPIKKLSWIHGTGSQSTWIKDLVIAKMDELDLLPETYYYDDTTLSIVNGVTYTVNDDRSITGNGTIGTNNNESRFCFKQGDRVKPGKYLLYAKLDKVPAGSCVIWQFGKRTNSIVVNVKQVSVDTTNPMIIVDTTDIDYDSDNIFFYNKTSGTVLTNATCRPIFIDLSEEDNIIPPVYTTQSVGTSYDVQVNNNINGTITLTGQSTAGAYGVITIVSKTIKIERGKRYLLTGCPKQTTTNYELVASFRKGSTAVGDAAVDIGNGIIFTAPQDDYDYLWLYLLNVTPNYNYENVIIDPKIVCIDADFRYSGLGNKIESMIDYSQDNEMTPNGVTYTRQENGILCNGTASGTAYFNITKDIPLKKDHVYYLKTNIPDNHTGVDTYTTYQIYVHDSDGGIIVDGYTYDIRESGKYITALKDGNIICVAVTYNGYTHDNTFLTADIYDVTDRDILSYPYQNATTTKNGVTFTDNGDGSITASGTATTDTRFYIKGETVKLNYSGPIWVYGCPKSSGGGSYFNITCSAYKYIEGVAKFVLSKRTTYTDGLFDTGGKDYDFLEICIFVSKDITVTDLVFRPHAIMIFPYNDNYMLPIRTTYYENLINMSDFEQTSVQANDYYAGFIVQLTSDNIYKYFPTVNEVRGKKVTIDFDIDNDRYKKELVVYYSEAVNGSYNWIQFDSSNNFTNTLPNKIPIRFEFRARFQSKAANGTKVRFSNFYMYNSSSTDITTIERTSKLKNGFKLNKINNKLDDVKLHPGYVNKVELLTDVEPDLFDISYYTYHNTNEIAYSGGHIEDSNGELRDLKIYGNTVYEDADTIPSPDKQNKMLSVGDKTQNLIKYPFASTTKTVNGVMFTDNGDGTITVNGTATADCWYPLATRSVNSIQANSGTYYLSGCPTGGSASTYLLSVDVYNNATKVIDFFSTGNHSIKNLNSYTFTSLSCSVTVKAGTTVKNLIFKPMLVRIDNDSNLIKYPYANTDKVINGITFKVNSDRTITVSGTATDDLYYSLNTVAQRTIFARNKTYYLSGCPQGGGSDTYRLYADFRNGNDYVGSYKDYGIGKYIDISGIEASTVSISIKVTKGATLDNVTFNPHLLNVDFEPYGYKVPIIIDSRDNLVNIDDFSATQTNNYFAVRYVDMLLSSNAKYLPDLANMKGKYVEYRCDIDNDKFSPELIWYYSEDKTKYITFKVGTPKRIPDEDVVALEFRGRSDSADLNGTTVNISNISLKYAEPTKTEYVFIDEPLRKVDDYADYIDFSRNMVVRNVGTVPVKALRHYKDFDTVYSYRCGGGYVTNANKTSSYNTPNICDYFKSISGSEISTNKKSDVIACRNEDLYTFISKERVDSRDAGKEFINNLGATMFYALATPVETSVVLPKIEINEGNNELVVNTSVEPSKIQTMYVKK